MMSSGTEAIVLTLTTHPFQVVLGVVVLFYAICETLAALPLKPRARVFQDRIPKAA
jgi:hypothetical protein